ncbi:hypothetical protein [Pseudomonas sp. R76]|uniref:hypothetical protein n=1 Tax=Pseudomonas sp. R76 TaxID=1573711 RepID=UPI00131FCBFE|nr:hypothetical protein [Pseudomonas sp. R76]QHD09211.1 hypothetical protein PspR76_27295 [Pseudomonas sp. R76]
MNYFFDRDAEGDGANFIGVSGYGRVDDIEPLDPEGFKVLLALNVMKKESLEQCGLQRGDRQLVKKPLKEMKVNPYESAVIFRVEIEVDIKGAGYSNIEEFEGDHWGRWFTVTVNGYGAQSGDAKLYSKLFRAPVDADIRYALVSERYVSPLNREFSLDTASTIRENRFEQSVRSRLKSAEYLAVYDVGQGNANAFITSQNSACPSLYYDLGAGIGSNLKTMPMGLTFCLCNSPLIILSHWDKDHWAGALIKSGVTAPALNLRWIVPRQQLDPVHKTFAFEIIAAGGSVKVLDLSPNQIVSFKLVDGSGFSVTRGVGNTKNSSGFVLVVENNDANYPASWVLTGDYEYRYFPTGLTFPDPVVLLAPHHGASIKPTSIVPPPSKVSQYRRLIYSFGPDNRFRACQHPTISSVTAHMNSHWAVGDWDTSPGADCFSGDIRSTANHSPSLNRGGVLVGWEQVQGALPSCGTNAALKKT